MEQEKQLTSLPENAYRELKPGEEYTPIMPASSSPREVTPYSVTMGIVMAIVFSAAAAFLDRTLKSECHICSPDIIVDCLWKSNHIQAFL